MPIEPALPASEGRMPRASWHGASGRQDAGSERPARWQWPEREPRWQPRYVNTGTFREALVGDLVSSTVSTPLS